MSNLCDLGHKYEQSLREHIKRRCAGVNVPQPRLLQSICNEVYQELIRKRYSWPDIESASNRVISRWIANGLAYETDGFVEFTESGFRELTRG